MSNQGIGTEEMKQTYESCAKNQYHWYPGWTSEGPYFGSCMGSVVSGHGMVCRIADGKFLGQVGFPVKFANGDIKELRFTPMCSNLSFHALYETLVRYDLG